MLAQKDEQHRTERDVRILCAQQIADILNPINLRTHQPMSSMVFSEFVETRFFPYLKDKIQREKRKPHVHQPKTDASIDKVPVIPSLRTVLNEYRKTVPNNPTDWIFDGNRKHTPLNLANLVRREMLPNLKPGTWHGWHGFRRGLATRLHEAGVQLEVIQEILRHSDPKVTQDSYIVVKSDKTTQAMQKVDSRAVLNAWKKTGQSSREARTKGHIRRRSAVFVGKWTKDGRNQLSGIDKSPELMRSVPR